MDTLRSAETYKRSALPYVGFLIAAVAVGLSQDGASNTGQTGAEARSAPRAVGSKYGLSYNLNPRQVGSYRNSVNRSARISELEEEARAAVERGDIKACEDAVYSSRQIRVRHGDMDFTFCYEGEPIDSAPSTTSTTASP